MSTRDEYIQKMHALLDKMNAEIDDLSARAGEAKADVRDEYQERIAQLRAKQEEARTKLASLRDAGEGAWQDLKAGVEMAWDAVGEAIDSAKSHFKK
jgi:vacuolar-type H+-ATPase subunit I/STV1